MPRVQSGHALTIAGLVALGLTYPVAAQEQLTLGVDLAFYGDNTEFFNPWREGETLLGSEGRLFLDVDFNQHVTLRTGLFGNHRFGDADLFHIVRPVLALHLQNDFTRFIIGSLESIDIAEFTPSDDLI